MTNGEILDEMLRKTFPRTIFIRGINELNKTQSIVFSDEWLKMPSAQPEQRWIPVSERLPEEIGTYMTTVDYGKYGLATGQRYYHGKELGWEDDCVTAWMPLPEPYKAESEVQDEDGD